jgi:hypothetical protein
MGGCVAVDDGRKVCGKLCAIEPRSSGPG